jgi:hypothetical protein
MIEIIPSAGHSVRRIWKTLVAALAVSAAVNLTLAWFPANASEMPVKITARPSSLFRHST